MEEEYYNKKIQNGLKKQKVKIICIRIITIFLLALIIINFIILLQMKIMPEQTPSIFGLKTFCIISGSMKPEIEVNDIIIIKEVNQEEIKINDIISFKNNQEIITHRVTNIEYGTDGKVYYTTKGDANNAEDDEKITFEKIEGKYIFKIKKLGAIVTALQNKTTLIITMIMLVILYLIEQKNTLKKEKRSRERAEYEKNKEQ